MPASRATSRKLRVETLRLGPTSLSAAAMMSSREITALRPGVPAPGKRGGTTSGVAGAASGMAVMVCGLNSLHHIPSKLMHKCIDKRIHVRILTPIDVFETVFFGRLP